MTYKDMMARVSWSEASGRGKNIRARNRNMRRVDIILDTIERTGCVFEAAAELGMVPLDVQVIARLVYSND